MYKSEIKRALELKDELKAAMLRDECGNSRGSIKALLNCFAANLEGRPGKVSVAFFCAMAERHLDRIKVFRKKGGQAILPGTIPLKREQRV